MVFKVVQRGGVYTGLSKGARGILFPNNSHERLAVEDGKDTKRGNAALFQESGQAGFIEHVEDPMTDGFPQAGEIMEQGLSLDAEFVLIGLPKVPPIE